jgi:hypothetical protein
MTKPRASRGIRVQKKRDFEPQHLLMHVAEIALEDAQKKIPGWKNQELVAITFSALALEALANSFGSKLVSRWDGFDSSSPIAKLRIICEELGISPDWSKGHWGTALWLVNFRNKIAHARSQPVKYDKIISDEKFKRTFHDAPPSDLESQVNLGNAKQAVNALTEIKWEFLSKLKVLKPGKHSCLYSDGFSGNTA